MSEQAKAPEPLTRRTMSQIKRRAHMCSAAAYERYVRELAAAVKAGAVRPEEIMWYEPHEARSAGAVHTSAQAQKTP